MKRILVVAILIVASAGIAGAAKKTFSNYAPVCNGEECIFPCEEICPSPTLEAEPMGARGVPLFVAIHPIPPHQRCPGGVYVIDVGEVIHCNGTNCTFPNCTDPNLLAGLTGVDATATHLCPDTRAKATVAHDFYFALLDTGHEPVIDVTISMTGSCCAGGCLGEPCQIGGSQTQSWVTPF